MTTYVVAATASLLVAAIGLGVQGMYLFDAVRDFRASKNRDNTVRFFVVSRIISSGSLGVVHLVVVISLALIRPSAVPDTAAFELVGLRSAVSTLVIISTTINYIARYRAIGYVHRTIES